MNQERFHGITDTGSLDFCVDADSFGHLEIGAFIDKNVANPFVMLDNWNLGIFHNKTNEPLSPSGDDDVERVLEAEHLVNCLSIDHGDQLDGVFGESCFL